MAEGNEPNPNMVGGIYFKTIDVLTGILQFNIPSNYRAIIAVTDSNPSNNGLYFIFSTGSGSVFSKVIESAEDFSLSTSRNTLTISINAGSRLIYIVGNINGFNIVT